LRRDDEEKLPETPLRANNSGLIALSNGADWNVREDSASLVHSSEKNPEVSIPNDLLGRRKIRKHLAKLYPPHSAIQNSHSFREQDVLTVFAATGED
jgi:hypothetical protein